MADYKNVVKNYITCDDDYENLDYEQVFFTANEINAGGTKAEDVKFMYTYPKGEGSLFVQFDEMETTSGIFSTTVNGNTTYKIGFTLDPNIPSEAKTIDMVTKLEEMLFEFIYSSCKKNKLKIFKAAERTHVDIQFKFRLLVDHQDGNGKKVFYLKLLDLNGISKKTGKPWEMKARFFCDTDNGEEDLTWNMLQRKSFRCRPVVQFYRGFMGANTSVQATISDGFVVSDIEEAKADANLYEAAKKKVAEKDPELRNRMAEKVRALKSKNQDIKGVHKNTVWDSDDKKKSKSKSKKETKEEVKKSKKAKKAKYLSESESSQSDSSESEPIVEKKKSKKKSKVVIPSSDSSSSESSDDKPVEKKSKKNSPPKKEPVVEKKSKKSKVVIPSSSSSESSEDEPVVEKKSKKKESKPVKSKKDSKAEEVDMNDMTG